MLTCMLLCHVSWNEWIAITWPQDHYSHGTIWKCVPSSRAVLWCALLVSSIEIGKVVVSSRPLGFGGRIRFATRIHGPRLLVVYGRALPTPISDSLSPAICNTG